MVVADAEYIFVNGIVASPFAVNHAIGHAFYSLYNRLNSLLQIFGFEAYFKSYLSSGVALISDFLMTL